MARASERCDVTAIDAALGARRRRLPLSSVNEKTRGHRRRSTDDLKYKYSGSPGLNKARALSVNSVFLLRRGKNLGAPLIDWQPELQTRAYRRLNKLEGPGTVEFSLPLVSGEKAV
jgi:hypothetical protein